MKPRGNVAHYYDRNTGRFLRFGGGGVSHAIHRQLWGPGVTTAEAAAGYINLRIVEKIEEILPSEPAGIVDMGCGVGGTVFHLAEQFPRTRFTGITISPRQHGIATRLADERLLAERCRFLEHDFQSFDPGAVADVVVAIESFTHSDTPQLFFSTAAGLLRAGGFAILVDDFLDGDPEKGAWAPGQVSALRKGWRLKSLCAVSECTNAAERNGLRVVSQTDLTGFIRLGRPRDRLISLFSPLMERLQLVGIPFFGNMIGGNALQMGLQGGYLKYHMLVLRKEEPSG